MAVRFSEVGRPPALAELGVQAGNRVAGLYDNLMGGFSDARQIQEQNRILGARQSLADLGAAPTPEQLSGASLRLATAGDIKGAQALADLGLAQEDRAFRRTQEANTQAYRKGMLGLQRDQLSAKAPDTTTIYDPETGGTQTGMWNPQTRTFEPVGGVKAPTANVAGPRTTTIYDPETGQPQAAQWDAQAQDWKPIGGVKKAAPRPVPAAIQKAESEDLLDVQTVGQVNQMLDGFVKQIDAGTLTLGPLENVQSRFQNWTGNSSPNSRNYQSFMSGLEKMRNETLRLNKGVQTEGDAVRAWNEVFANVNDPQVVKQRLKEIQGFNAAAAQFRVNQIRLRRETNNLDPLDVSGMTVVQGKDNGRVQPGTPQQRASGGNFSEGQTATNPQTGEMLIFRGGQWVPAQ